MLDSRLSERGIAQAKAAGDALARESIDLIYASDLGRTQQTAALIAEALGAVGLTIKLDRRLRERSYGDLESLTWPEIERAHPEAFVRINARDPDYAPSNGESPIMFRDRVIPALTEIARASEGSRILVITHGGVVGTLYRHAMSMSLDEKRRYALFNASINRFRYVDDTWHMDVWGDISHLDDLLPRDEP